MGVEGDYYEGPCKLLELPHDVLRILFSYVDATTLFHLSQTCNYLNDFIEDLSFWRYIDAREEPNVPDKLEYCTNKVHEKSTHLLLQGNLNLYDLPNDFFDKIRPYQNLRVLALENLKLHGSKVTLKDFPSGLEELSLRRTYLKNSKYFFQHSVRNMPKLKVLILDECCWVTCSFLLSVSKYEHLEIISIVKCIRVHMNMIPYLNVSKFGCKKLKVVDCRFTGIGGDLIRTFFSSNSIQRLYFQSFNSGEVDYNEKIIESVGVAKIRSPANTTTDISISDNHLADYATASSKPKSEIEPVFQSVLYQDPYPACTCGVDGSNEHFKVDEAIFCEDDILNIPYGRGETKFVCNKHMKDVVDLPSSFRNFFLTQQNRFNPASEADEDTDTNSEDEEDGCCYFGMGSKMVLPSTPDRTPSRTEEMSLPEEGARNQSPRVLILNPLREMERENGDRNSDRPNSSGNNANRESSSSRTKTKKRRANSDDSDCEGDELERKKVKLEESLLLGADLVRNGIERIGMKNGFQPFSGRSRDEGGPSRPQRSPDQLPSSSSAGGPSERGRPLGSPPSPDSTSGGGGAGASDRSGGGSSAESTSDSEDSEEREGPAERQPAARNVSRMEPFNNRNYVIFNEQDRRRLKFKIPLRRLSLRGYSKITDLTLLYLKNVDLELIDLTYTCVSKQGIDDFLVHNPNCRVIHPLHCRCKPNNSLF